jgi:hypothetical protein
LRDREREREREREPERGGDFELRIANPEKQGAGPYIAGAASGLVLDDSVLTGITPAHALRQVLRVQEGFVHQHVGRRVFGIGLGWHPHICEHTIF